jgi:hypothetical protein
MTCDFMGAKQRAWVLASAEWFFDEALAFPDLIVVEGQVPVLALPLSIEHDPPRLELAFGWAMAELTEQSRGWVAMCGIVRRRVAEVASAAAVLLVCLAGAALVLQ